MEKITKLLKSQKCYLCNYKTNYTSAMEKHIKKHHKIKYGNKESLDKTDHICKYCNYITKDVSQIRDHLKIHNNEIKKKEILNKFKCKYCNISSNKFNFIISHTRKEHKNNLIPANIV